MPLSRAAQRLQTTSCNNTHYLRNLFCGALLQTVELIIYLFAGRRSGTAGGALCLLLTMFAFLNVRIIDEGIR